MSDETPVPGELAIGDHLAGYRLDEIIARGGMAVVYRAFAGPPYTTCGVRWRPAPAPVASGPAASSGRSRPAPTPSASPHPPAAGVLPSGTTPRQFALEPGGRTLLVAGTGSGQLQADQIARLP